MNLERETRNPEFITRKNFFLLALFLTLLFPSLYGQAEPKVIVPAFNDKYSDYIAKLEAGQLDIDYQDFRFSFINSEQFKIANSRSEELDSLKTRMYELIKDRDYPQIIKVTKEMLSIDYTSMIAHKILRQTYKAMGDSVNHNHYHDIQFGLMRSILSKGDGKSCETAWPVIQISEEYFILGVVLDAELKKQSLITKGGLCDRMDVKVGKKKKTYYFEVTKVFDGYKR